MTTLEKTVEPVIADNNQDNEDKMLSHVVKKYDQYGLNTASKKERVSKNDYMAKIVAEKLKRTKK